MLTSADIEDKAEQIEASYGDFISHNDLSAILHIEKPKLDESMTIYEYDKEMRDYQFEKLRVVEIFKDAMLEKRGMYLKSSRGEGYIIIKASEHSGEAKQIVKNGIDKIFDKAKSLLDNTRIVDLSITEQTEHQETSIRITNFKNMIDNHKEAMLKRNKIRGITDESE